MILIEVVIDLDVHLVAVEIVGSGPRAAGSADGAAGPAVDCGIQAVHGVAVRGRIGRRTIVSVRWRHVPKQSGHESGRVHPSAERIARIERVAEDAEALHRAGRTRYLCPVQWNAQLVHHWGYARDA